MFIPQILNFIYSVPQLFGFIACPKHRLPRYDVSTNKLHTIKTNLNLINLILWILGPTSEEKLCDYLLILQLLSSIVGFACRYALGNFLF
jgi:UDP-N-acetylglucosamine--dolichyl-phosphate N-acetylglucosaminephosphotransferase